MTAFELPEATRSLDRLVEARAAVEPEARALVSDGEVLLLGELHVLAGAAAAYLARAGIGPGDRVALWGQNSVAWAAWLLGTARLGAAIVALHPGLGERELVESLTQSRASWLVLDQCARGRSLEELAHGVLSAGSAPDLRGITAMPGGDGCPRIRSVVDLSAPLPDCQGDPDAPLAYLFTSGSSGRPKLVQLSHRALILNAVRTAEAAGIVPGDCLASPLPLHHAGGLSSGLVLALAVGACWCSQHRFQPLPMLELIERERCTVLQGVPTMFKALVEHAPARPVSSLRLGFIGGAHAPARLCEDAVRGLSLERMCIVYGQSEFGPTISLTRGHEAVTEAHAGVGMPLPGAELRIVDLFSGKMLRENLAGEVQVRGDTCMDGYFGDPAATRAALNEDGWLRTGDLGLLSNGCLHLQGRLKNLIIRGGENVSASEVEEALLTLDALADACVVALPSAHWGETVCAVMRPREGSAVDADLVQSHAQQRLARYKRPEHVLVWPSFPLLPSGKVDRRRVRAEAAAQLGITL